MNNVEISYLREKKKAYDDVIEDIAKLLIQNDINSPYYKALESMIRTLQNQRRMIKFAIHSRETKQ